MSFIPSLTRYSRQFKLRKYQTTRLSHLRYGTSGLRLEQPWRFTSKNLEKLSLILKKITKRSEKTYRFYWINVFPYQVVTQKPLGVRMGKGKGKKVTWATLARAGLIFLEFKNIRLGRLFFFLKKLSSILGSPVSYVFLFNFRSNSSRLNSSHINNFGFWY